MTGANGQEETAGVRRSEGSSMCRPGTGDESPPEAQECGVDGVLRPADFSSRAYSGAGRVAGTAAGVACGLTETWGRGVQRDFSSDSGASSGIATLCYAWAEPRRGRMKWCGSRRVWACRFTRVSRRFSRLQESSSEPSSLLKNTRSSATPSAETKASQTHFVQTARVG